MKVALVGSSGEIDQLIQRKVLLKNNYDYVRFGISEDRLGSSEGIPFFQYDLIKDELIIGDDFSHIIYCAYDFRDLRTTVENVNYQALKRIKFHNNCKMIYTSSVMADNPLSLYGQVKKQIEKYIDEIGGYSLRIGAVESEVPISNIKILSNVALKLNFLILPGINSQILVSTDNQIAKAITDIFDNVNSKKSSSIVYAVSYISTFKACIKKVTKNQVILINFLLKLLNPLFYFSKKLRILQQISDKFENLKLKPNQYSSWRPEQNQKYE